MSKYIDAEKLIERLEEMKRVEYENCGGVNSKTGALQEVQELITSLQQEQTPTEREIAEAHRYAEMIRERDRARIQQEQPKKRLIQVKCLYPYDESWQKNKVYTCKVWRHGDLNRDFWDVYYDYGKDPRYVQFPSIELLNEEFVVIQEQPEVDLEKEIEKYCKIYYNCNYPDQIQNGRCSPVMPHIVEAARHFAEWGAIHLNARKEDK